VEGPRELRVLTWNLFHGRDGGPGPTLASTALRRPVRRDGHTHLNRRWHREMGEVIRSLGPDVAALQEVSPTAIEEVAQAAGMTPASAIMRPLVGSIGLRGRLAAQNPDLWRTLEGAANVLLVRPPWEIVPGSVRRLRQNPPGVVAAAARRLRLPPREALHWFLEPRTLVAARLRAPGTGTVTAASVHLHNSLVWEVIAVEARRTARFVVGGAPPGEPVVVAGDLNASGARHPALAAFAAAGLDTGPWPRGPGGPIGLDHILHRGLEVVSPPRRLAPAVREVVVRRRRRDERVLLSDHDPVEAVFRAPPYPPTAVRT
jgi:hypothetical protein